MTTTVVTESHSYLQLAAAFCRGRLALALDTTDADAVAAGVRAGLRLHKFKRNAELPRVRRVLGAVAAFAPASLLDVGSGRGTFLWPLLDAFSALTVIAIDQSAQRASDLACVGRGGHAPLRAARMDATRLALASRSLDGVTALEVLEHLREPLHAVRELVRIAQRFVLVTVPAHADDNPEHLHLLTPERLRTMFEAAAVDERRALRLRFDAIRDHTMAVATFSDGPAV